MNIGNQIACFRKRKQLTQQELAEKLFVSDKTVSSWEQNRTEPSLELIVKLSEILSCRISDLLYIGVEKNNIETEIKIKITEEEYTDLEKFMKENAIFKEESRQLDTYYQPSNRNFVNKEKIETKQKISEWLRIGERGNKSILNYKKWYDVHCDEYEVEIDDTESLKKIFKALEIEKLITVNKTRITYFYLNKYEVALDYVKNLGYFIEIEIKKYTKEIKKEYDDLIKVIKNLNLNLNAIDKRGYPYHLIEKQFKKNHLLQF